MDTQELLVEQGSEGQAVKGLHTGVIHPFRVFNFTCSEDMATTENMVYLCSSFFHSFRTFSHKMIVLLYLSVLSSATCRTEGHAGAARTAQCRSVKIIINNFQLCDFSSLIDSLFSLHNKKKQQP